jgi:acyl transferase domain-containing protein
MSENQSPHDISQLLRDAHNQIKALRARLEEKDRERHEPIAIVGVGCRFPGGANSAESFWKLLADGVDTVRKVPEDRWDMDALFAREGPVPDHAFSRDGSFLDKVDEFDHEFFGIAPAEAIHLDPQQRLMLETAWEALENAGLAADQLKGERAGVFVGAIYADYLIRQLREAGPESINAYYGTGNTLSAMAGRLSYYFGWLGPSIAVDTACSTSLVAVHLACNAIRNNECDMALAGGVNLMLTPEPMINLSKARMMSSTGRCRTFDAGADGYVRSEGAGVVVLKRLSAAEANGDRILGLILGSAVNHDGRSNGLTAPSRQAQASLLRAATRAAGVAPADVGYVECHGTGTPLGDPIEVGAIMDALLDGRPEQRPLALGAVKTN